MNGDTKPPLGLEPHYIWTSKRVWAIIEAMGRYRTAGKDVPQEWILELYDLLPPSRLLEPPQINIEVLLRDITRT